MKIMNILLISVMMMLFALSSFCQVSISNDSSLPDSSAMLDVKSAVKGLLVPRMTLIQRNQISHPAAGLMIYCTENNLYYFNKGTSSVPNWLVMNTQWLNTGSKIYYSSGFVGINTSNAYEWLHVANGNIRLDGTDEQALIMSRTLSGTGPSGHSKNPMFSIGRIVRAGDGDPELRVLYHDDSIAGEFPVFEFDRKGIVTSVKPTSPSNLKRGSHFEGFYSGAVYPYFRLNSYPRMRLEMGDGGGTDVDVAVERLAMKKMCFYTDTICRAVIDSAGKMGIGTQTPTTKLEVNGMIYSSNLGYKFPDGSVQTKAAPGGKSPWVTSGTGVYYNSGNVGIGTDHPQASTEIARGDLLISTSNTGVILTSPNGKRWRLTVDDNGGITTTAVSPVKGQADEK